MTGMHPQDGLVPFLTQNGKKRDPDWIRRSVPWAGAHNADVRLTQRDVVQAWDAQWIVTDSLVQWNSTRSGMKWIHHDTPTRSATCIILSKYIAHHSQRTPPVQGVGLVFIGIGRYHDQKQTDISDIIATSGLWMPLGQDNLNVVSVSISFNGVFMMCFWIPQRIRQSHFGDANGVATVLRLVLRNPWRGRGWIWSFLNHGKNGEGDGGVLCIFD